MGNDLELLKSYSKQPGVVEKVGNTAFKAGAVGAGVMVAAAVLPFITAPMLFVMLLIFGVLFRDW
jgi:hypothetical protein